MIFDIGQVGTLGYTLKVAGVLTDATVVLTVTAPDGTTSTPAVTHLSLGKYQATVLASQGVDWAGKWVASGAATDVENFTFQAYPPGVIALADVKDALNKSLTVDDDELRRMLRAAEQEYADYVGPLPGSVVETFDGGSDRLILRAPLVTAITAAAYSDGSALAYTDLDLDSRTGIVYWKANTAGRFTAGVRNVTLTYTTAGLPANHRETIIADVAGYFEATQRGPLGPDDDGYASAYTSTPQVLFPRIRALAPTRIG